MTLKAFQLFSTLLLNFLILPVANADSYDFKNDEFRNQKIWNEHFDDLTKNAFETIHKAPKGLLNLLEAQNQADGLTQVPTAVDISEDFASKYLEAIKSIPVNVKVGLDPI